MHKQKPIIIAHTYKWHPKMNSFLLPFTTNWRPLKPNGKILQSQSQSKLCTFKQRIIALYAFYWLRMNAEIYCMLLRWRKIHRKTGQFTVIDRSSCSFFTGQVFQVYTIWSWVLLSYTIDRDQFEKKKLQNKLMNTFNNRLSFDDDIPIIQ